MKKSRVKVHYDAEADVLYIAFGAPQKARSIEVTEHEILRVNPKTNEIVGITLLDASKSEAALPITGNFTPTRELERKLRKASA